jgi:hypothetical protein
MLLEALRKGFPHKTGALSDCFAMILAYLHFFAYPYPEWYNLFKVAFTLLLWIGLIFLTFETSFWAVELKQL